MKKSLMFSIRFAMLSETINEDTEHEHLVIIFKVKCSNQNVYNTLSLYQNNHNFSALFKASYYKTINKSEEKLSY